MFFNFVCLILCNREVYRHWVCKKGHACLVWKVLFTGWQGWLLQLSKKPHLPESQNGWGRKAPLEMGYSKLWLRRDTEQVAQGCFSFGFWNPFAYQRLALRQPFIDKKLQGWHHCFQLSTKIANDGMKEWCTSSPRDSSQIKRHGSRIFYISLQSSVERQHPRDVICLRN